MKSRRKYQLSDLERWFSQARMSRFKSSHKAGELYVWNTRVAKALLEDTQHVEVLLRNTIDRAMSAEINTDWIVDIPYYDPRFSGRGRVSKGHDPKYTRNVHKAIRRSGPAYSNAIKGRIIAELSFDHWRFLLTPSKEPTAWMYLKRHLPDYSIPGKPRQDFEDTVEYIRRLRNRLAHHEPITRKTLSEEHQYLKEATQELNQLAQWLDADAARWIQSNSRVQSLWRKRPVATLKERIWLWQHPLS